MLVLSPGRAQAEIVGLGVVVVAVVLAGVEVSPDGSQTSPGEGTRDAPEVFGVVLGVVLAVVALVVEEAPQDLFLAQLQEFVECWRTEC